MLEFVYKRVLLITICFLLFFGLYLLFGKTIKTENLKNYLKARILLGSAFMFYAVMYYLQWRFNLRDNDWHVATALNLASYYIFAMLLGISFTILLNKNYITKKRLKYGIVKCIIYVGYIFVIFLIPSQLITEIGLLIGVLFFMIDVGWSIIKLLKAYNKALSNMSNYFSDDMESNINWFKNSLYFIIFVGMTAPIITFTNKFLVTIQSVLILCAYIYLFISFVNYAVTCQVMNIALNTERDGSDNNTDNIASGSCIWSNSSKDNNDKYKQIGEALDGWVSNKGFITKGITIDQLTQLIGTNRTYLSFYINSTFGNSFREWITILRIEEAKRLMLEQPTMKITKVSEQVGFLTDSHFVRQFSAREKISPAKWREKEFLKNTSI